MNTRATVIIIFLSLASWLITSCGSDDPPTAPNNTGGGDPTITALSPPAAGAGIMAKIIGTNFGANKRAGTVVIASQSAEIVSWSDTEIEFIVPAEVTSDAMVSYGVTTSAGKTVSSQIDITPPNTYRVTTDNASDRYPCWGPGGNLIYFCSTRSGGANWDLYRIPATGGEAQRLTQYEGPDFYPDVRASDGEVAWSSTRDHLGYNLDGDYEIFSGHLAGVSGGQVTIGILTSNVSRDLDPAWADTPYGGYNMVSTWEEVDANGNFLAWTVVLHGNGEPTELTEGRQPNFSSNGQWVVYTYQNDIYKIPTTEGAPVQLTDTGYDWYPHWGWGNDKIIFQRYANSEDIYVMNSDGTDVQPLLEASYGEYSPSWSADCSKVVYGAHRWSNFDIYVYVVP